MPWIGRSAAALRIFGDDLDPEYLTSLLGAAPTKSWRKGEVKSHSHAGRPILAKTGTWIRDAARRKPGNLDEQIVQIFCDLSRDMELWRRLRDRFHMDLFVGLFMNESNEGIRLSLESLATLSARGVELQLDI